MFTNRIFAIAAIATFMVAGTVTVNAQDVREVLGNREVLTDRTSESVQEFRKDLNDNGLLHEMEARGQYKDHVPGYDSNVTQPIRLCSKYQASQGFSVGVFGGCSYFAGNFLPRVGVEATYGYRWLYGTLWASLGRGVYDEDASKSEDFLEENFGLEVGAEFAHWKDHHHQVYFLIGGELKLRKDFKDMSFGEDTPVDFQYTFNGRTFGAYAGLKYQYSPKFSSWSMYVKATGGFNQNYKGNILSSVYTENYQEYSIGGTKIYPEVTVTIGVNLNVFNKKVYNTRMMNKLGYSKKDVKALRNY